MPIRTAKTYFYPRSPCGERPIKRERGYYSYTFLSTLSLRRATRAWPNIGPAKWISIHALLAESDLYQHGRPARRVISIHALLAESDFTVKVGRSNRNISIHALLAESDANANFMVERVSYFYPRSPCGERLCSLGILGRAHQFLSTLSLRRATRTPPRARTSRSHFYPRSPCGERPAAGLTLQQLEHISIHALLAESDTVLQPRLFPQLHISIHALLAESDGPPDSRGQAGDISIHALLAESDFGATFPFPRS